MRFTALVGAAILSIPTAALAQNKSDTLSLLGKGIVSLGFGLATESTSSVGGTETTRASGEVGAIVFSRWVRPTVAVQISAEVVGANSTRSFGHRRDDAITPILFGLSVSPRSLALSRSVRPYFSIAAGPFIRSVSEFNGTSTTNDVETVPGARLALGANWFAARHFVFGVEGSYRAASDFEHADALTEKARGFGMLVLFGFAWGGQ
jgi:hypothetical protein